MITLVWLTLALAAPQQQAPAAEVPTPATIRGRVVDGTTGKPLAMTRMRLASTTRGGKTVSIDIEGQDEVTR